MLDKIPNSRKPDPKLWALAGTALTVLVLGGTALGGYFMTLSQGALRDGQAKDVKVALSTIPDANQHAVGETGAKRAVLAGLGLSLAPTPSRDGVVIAKVDQNGAAAASGLQQGDLIVSVGATKVATPADVEKQVAEARNSGLKAILLRVQSGSEVHDVGVSFASA